MVELVFHRRARPEDEATLCGMTCSSVIVTEPANCSTCLRSEKLRAANARHRERDARTQDLLDAERDCVFAAHRLATGDVRAGLLNVAIATVRIAKHMTDEDFAEVMASVRVLRSALSSSEDSGAPAPERPSST